MDIDYVVGKSHLQFMPRGPPAVAVLRMFGVTAAGASSYAKLQRGADCVLYYGVAPCPPPVARCAGNSVCCHVHGFEPYFYAAMPQGFGPDDVDTFRKALNVR